VACGVGVRPSSQVWRTGLFATAGKPRIGTERETKLIARVRICFVLDD